MTQRHWLAERRQSALQVLRATRLLLKVLVLVARQWIGLQRPQAKDSP
jgi:hypothetical protein